MVTSHVESLEARLCLSITDVDPTFGSGGTVSPAFTAGTRPGAAFLADDGDLLASRYFQPSPEFFSQVEVADVAPDGSVRWVRQVPQSPMHGALDVTGIARQPDGKTVLAVDVVYGNTGDVFLTRLNADGSIDNGFQPTLPIPSGQGDRPSITALAATTDGSTLVAEASGYAPPRLNVERIAADGSVATTFATNDQFVSRDIDTPNMATALAEQGDAKVIVAGFVDLGRRHLAVERFNADGSLDTSFGDQGKLITDLRLAPHSIALEADGRILLSATPRAPYLDNSLASSQPYLVAITPGGQLESSFGSGGIVADPGNLDQLTDVRLAGDGQSVYVAGMRRGQPALVQVAADGTVQSAARGSNIVSGDNPYQPFLSVTSDGHLISQPTSGTFERSVGLTVTPPLDGVSPSVALGRLRRVVTGSSTYSVSVAYTDVQSGVDPQTLGRTNVILRPTGKAPIRASSAAVSHHGSTWTVTYTFAAPGNSWGPEDAGTYRIQVVGAQVTDNAGDAVEATTLGSFTIPAASASGPGIAAAVAHRRKRTGDV